MHTTWMHTHTHALTHRDSHTHTHARAFLNIHRSGLLTTLFGCYMAGTTWNCCRLGARSAYTIQSCNFCFVLFLQRHFMQLHIRRVHVYLAVTCHLRFWQNDWDLLRATVVTRWWNGYRNKSQHRKLTLEKNFFPPLLPGLEPATFWSRVRRSNHWAIPVPSLDGSWELPRFLYFRCTVKCIC